MMTRFTLTPHKTATLACLLGLGFGTAFGTIQANAAETAQAASYTKLELTASGSVQAPPDQLAASFRAESRSNSAAAAQKAVNTQVSKAAEQAKQANGVKYAISHYSVSEMRDDKAKNAVWTASQDLTFTAPDGEALLPLTGQLQANGLILEGLDWSLSPDKQKALQLEAEKAAVTDLKKQADTLAATLGLHVVRFERISLSGSPYPRPIFMAAMARSSMDAAPAPSSTAETQTVHASVTATVLLAP
ncbi:SIMPL domain-containing protein [Acetobacter orientalis]|uniref:SIMPL domain-containing protein n=1 Tax=Acetobacter orientalis TaxID=146474 RepID=UPI00209CACD5|nr:SIMPL domain-containing protein [Acetobacter orientalis]MCP1215838.1 SIMPL domain-containing protein [Acetobacter orientalis]MCP1218002.1 SIMPL domain-containing protein [Acetobacter orientalis]